MPSSIQIKSIIKKFDKQLDSIIHEDIKILKDIKEYVIQSGGKRIRPLTHYFFANLLNYNGNEWLSVGAIAELIHAASLLHDDVVDNADTRRGNPTVGKLYGNKTAILAGDYLLACGIEHLNQLHNPVLMDSFTRVIRNLAVGELIQMQWERDPDISIKEYNQIIYGKTAALFEAVCETAGIISNANKQSIESLKKFGASLGSLFQIRDDYIDYFQTGKQTGKEYRKDFMNGLYTYPVIKLKEQLTRTEKKQLVKIFKEEIKTTASMEYIDTLFEKYRIAPILKEELDTMIQNLVGYLNTFPENDYKEVMVERILELQIE